MYQFKAKDLEIKKYSLFLGNILKDFAIDNMNRTGSNGYVYDISVDYEIIDTNDIVDIRKYFMKRTKYKIN